MSKKSHNKNECKHCLGISNNAIGEVICSCEFYGEDEGRNVTLGECFGNCDSQESENE